MESLILSRRNLIALLSKLDRAREGDVTACTLIKFKDFYEDGVPTQSMEAISITAVEDEDLYPRLGREPGAVHPKDLYASWPTLKSLCDKFSDWPEDIPEVSGKI